LWALGRPGRGKQTPKGNPVLLLAGETSRHFFLLLWVLVWPFPAPTRAVGEGARPRRRQGGAGFVLRAPQLPEVGLVPSCCLCGVGERVRVALLPCFFVVFSSLRRVVVWALRRSAPSRLVRARGAAPRPWVHFFQAFVSDFRGALLCPLGRGEEACSGSGWGRARRCSGGRLRGQEPGGASAPRQLLKKLLPAAVRVSLHHLSAVVTLVADFCGV
jgi:hypothetical protein